MQSMNLCWKCGTSYGGKSSGQQIAPVGFPAQSAGADDLQLYESVTNNLGTFQLSRSMPIISSRFLAVLLEQKIRGLGADGTGEFEVAVG
jgi:hypothetical protein